MDTRNPRDAAAFNAELDRRAREFLGEREPRLPPETYYRALANVIETTRKYEERRVDG